MKPTRIEVARLRSPGDDGHHRVSIAADLEQGDELQPCLARLDDEARAALDMPSRAIEKARRLLDDVDGLHWSLKEAERNVARELRFEAQARQRGETEFGDRYARSVAEQRQRIAELVEKIAARETEPEVVAARSLLKREPPARSEPAPEVAPVPTSAEAREPGAEVEEGDDIPFRPGDVGDGEDPDEFDPSLDELGDAVPDDTDDEDEDYDEDEDEDLSPDEAAAANPDPDPVPDGKPAA